MKFQTKVIHAGQAPDPQTGAVVTPLITATTFAQSSPGKTKGYDYSRVSTPTRKVLEDCLAELEEGQFAFALASGCSAMHLITQLLKPGELILAEEDLYGGSIRLLKHLQEVQNIKVIYGDFSNLQEIKEKLKSKPKMIWLESPTNPLLKIIDIEAVHKLRDRESSLLVVDNTFASPALQQPFTLGTDIVFHSATKYLGGHSDILGGAIIVKRKDLAEKFQFFVKTIGPVLSPVDSSLLLRSLKTLSLRMEAHNRNGLQVAEFLLSHPKVERVFYPGLPCHPQFAIAKKQMKGFTGMVSFYIKGGRKAAFSFLENLQLFILAESLGAVESLAEHPKSMTHGAFASQSVTESLIRLSVGVEHIDDLKEDLSQALLKA